MGIIVEETAHFRLVDGGECWIIEDKSVLGREVVDVRETKPHTSERFREYLEERARRERWTEEEREEAERWLKHHEEVGDVNSGIKVVYCEVDGRNWPMRFYLKKRFWSLPKVRRILYSMHAKREERLKEL